MIRQTVTLTIAHLADEADVEDLARSLRQHVRFVALNRGWADDDALDVWVDSQVEWKPGDPEPRVDKKP